MVAQFLQTGPRSESIVLGEPVIRTAPAPGPERQTDAPSAAPTGDGAKGRGTGQAAKGIAPESPEARETDGTTAFRQALDDLAPRNPGTPPARAYRHPPSPMAPRATDGYTSTPVKRS